MRIKSINLITGSDDVVTRVSAMDGYLVFTVSDVERFRQYVTVWLSDEERDRLRKLLEPKSPVDPQPVFNDGRTK